MTTDATKKKTVMVTGANGFLGSYIVQDLLESGHTVHACVRDAGSESSVAHLKALNGASDRLQLFSTGNLAETTSDTFDAPMKHCDAVIHTATPLNVKFLTAKSGERQHDGEAEIFQPAMTSTRELLTCLIERNADTVTHLVLTSSMAAVAPRPEPALKDESLWSDPEDQKARGNWYGATKTCQELLVRETISSAKASGKLSQEKFVFAAICPTMVIGPLLKPPSDPTDLGGTMGSLQRWMSGYRAVVPNDSMSFIHAQDCAKMHTKILELSSASDVNPHLRYMSLIESFHWNDIMKLWKELYPALPDYQEYQGTDTVTPTKFNLDAMKSLGVPYYQSMRQVMMSSIEYMQKVGAIP